MNPERWREIDKVLQSVLERAPEQRRAFLDEACAGDAQLRSEVESFIVAHEQAGGFIETPAIEVDAAVVARAQSASAAGQTIAHYQIIKQLGAGGMGEVYLATDTRMNRKVALKLLPSYFTSHEERIRRFKQEARAVLALNHPNIVTIFEIGEANSAHYIATEFIDGLTLRQQVAQAPLKITEVLDVAMQAASALVAAHAAGIVHRDIKPDNIMLRADGYVKVLDFGLAKLTERVVAAPATDPEALTRALFQTEAGRVMGTVSYMSPEQARGGMVDARSDIFSLGAVIYEMIAGVQPFAGDTPSDVLAAVLKTEPRPLSRINADVPAELERIVKKALRKNPDERYQGVKDMLLDVRTLREDLSFQSRLNQSATSNNVGAADAEFSNLKVDENRAAPTNEIKAAVSTIGHTLSGEIRRHKVATTLLLVPLLIVIVVGAIGINRLLNRSGKPLPFQLMKITSLTNHGKAVHTAISPDGKYFVYVLKDGEQSLWLRQISAANDTQIIPPGPVAYFGVTFSPDGTNLYYITKASDPNAPGPGVLYRVPVLGGVPFKLLEQIDGPVSFSPDGKQFAFVRRDFPNPGASGLFIANIDGSGAREIAARKAPEVFAHGFASPSWSRDGHLIACAVTNQGGGSQLIAVNVENGSFEVLTHEPWALIGRVEWLPDMTGLVMVAGGEASRSAQIFFVPYPGGPTYRITNDLESYRDLSLSADFKKLVTVQVSAPAKIWTSSEVNFSQASQLPTGNVGFVGWGDDSIAWTPDGRIVYVAYTDGSPQIWIMDSTGGNRRQLTHEGMNLMPAVSPDGHCLVFISTRAGSRNVWRMDLDGNDPKRLTSGTVESKPMVSADNRSVIYTSLTDGKLSLWRLPSEGGNPVLLVDKQVHAPAVSPDGKFIAYLYAEHFSDEAPGKLAIVAFDGGVPIKTFDVAGANIVSNLRWTPAGQSLLFSAGAKSGAMNIWEQMLAGGPPKQLTHFTEDYLAGFDLSRDGKQFVCERGNSTRDAVLIADLAKP